MIACITKHPAAATGGSVICLFTLFMGFSRQECWRVKENQALGVPGGSEGKASACNVGDPGSIPGWGRSPGGGHGNPLQYSCLENPHGQRSLAGCSPWGHKESNTTERPSTAQTCVRPSMLYSSLSRWKQKLWIHWHFLFAPWYLTIVWNEPKN